MPSLDKCLMARMQAKKLGVISTFLQIGVIAHRNKVTAVIEQGATVELVSAGR